MVQGLAFDNGIDRVNLKLLVRVEMEFHLLFEKCLYLFYFFFKSAFFYFTLPNHKTLPFHLLQFN